MPFTFGVEKLEPAFSDRPVPYIAYGGRFHQLVAEHVQNTLSASRVYLIASAGLTRSTPAAIERMKTALGDKLVGTRIGMSPHTSWDEVIEVANDAAQHSPDCIITLGAGSLTDASKVIAWMLANDVTTSSELEHMWKGSPTLRTDLKPPTIRTIAIPTSLSGGEYNTRGGVTRTDGSHQKVGFVPPPRNPSLVILDPELVTTTPERVWLSSGVRAVDHCVETLCSLQSTDVGDEAAGKGLLRLVPALLRTKHDPTDQDARFETMMGVIDAMTAVGSGVTLGASHGIGHQLGPLGVGHGETSCVMLPAVCKYNAAQGANIERQEHCKQLMLQSPVVRDLVAMRLGGDETKIDLADVLDLFIRELGMPRTLKDVGIGRNQLDGLAVNALKDPCSQANAVPLTEKGQVLEILEMVVE